jgi:hypothetical protein
MEDIERCPALQGDARPDQRIGTERIQNIDQPDHLLQGRRLKLPLGRNVLDAGSDGPPAWAQRMKRSQSINRGVSAADHAIRSGDRPSGGSQVDLFEGN